MYTHAFKRYNFLWLIIMVFHFSIYLNFCALFSFRFLSFWFASVLWKLTCFFPTKTFILKALNGIRFLQMIVITHFVPKINRNNLFIKKISQLQAFTIRKKNKGVCPKASTVTSRFHPHTHTLHYKALSTLTDHFWGAEKLCKTNIKRIYIVNKFKVKIKYKYTKNKKILKTKILNYIT